MSPDDDALPICTQCGAEMESDNDEFGHPEGPLCSEACFMRITADDDPLASPSEEQA